MFSDLAPEETGSDSLPKQTECVLISVVIPVLNESETVGRVVTSALNQPEVEEVIVVDDGSIDDTPDIARHAGARVLTSTYLGKGASLRDGLQAANNKIVLFLDAHLSEVPAALFRQLSAPISEGKADVCTANCPGSLSPICHMTARPLVRTFYPELNPIEFPLSGLWAAKRSLLQKLTFELDHSVEIGILLDAVNAGAKFQQVDIDPVNVKEERAEFLVEIADQVVRTILNRAAAHNRLKNSLLEIAEEQSPPANNDLECVLRNSKPDDRIALFDMDGVMVRSSFVVELAWHTDKGAELSQILDDLDLSEEERIQKVASLFAGVPKKTFKRVAHEMPLMPGAKETVSALRKAGYVVGVVSDGFDVPAEIIRRRVFGDFSIAHQMKFKRGKATGRVNLVSALSHPHGCAKHTHCKANIISYINDEFGITPERVLAVANSEDDICLLESAGESVAFRPNRPAVRAAAEVVIEGALSDLLHSLQKEAVSV